MSDGTMDLLIVAAAFGVAALVLHLVARHEARRLRSADKYIGRS